MYVMRISPIDFIYFLLPYLLLRSTLIIAGIMHHTVIEWLSLGQEDKRNK